VLDLLILTAAYGEGHNAAAHGLCAAARELGGTAEIVDVFATIGGDFYHRTRAAYLAVINRTPWLWSATYRLVDAVPFGRWAEPILAAARHALAREFDAHQPRAVASVYPMYGYFVDHLFRNRQRPFPFVTVVTDSITINRIWYRCGSDRFFVANEATARVMHEAGVPKEKLSVLGFPVSPLFARAHAVRADPGSGGPRLLFMINAGKTQAPAIVARLLALPRKIDLTVTVGRDEVLRRRIEAAASRPIEIHGWTDRMPELLMNHHLLIGKAGGAAVQEAIAARTPMLITSVVPGQEEGNAQLLTEHGCGAVCATPEKIAETVDALFCDEAKQWHAWERAIGALSRPGAALDIARAIFAMPRPASSSR
jgi:processive 1,2-diacylglycerol beta-glucosyltransferase